MALKILKMGFLFTFGFGFLILINLLPVANADTNDADRYAPPPNKANIPVCQKKALLLHPGAIKGLRLLHQEGAFLFQIRITANDGLEKIVLCNGETGNIIRAEADR